MRNFKIVLYLLAVLTAVFCFRLIPPIARLSLLESLLIPLAIFSPVIVENLHKKYEKRHLNDSTRFEGKRDDIDELTRIDKLVYAAVNGSVSEGQTKYLNAVLDVYDSFSECKRDKSSPSQNMSLEYLSMYIDINSEGLGRLYLYAFVDQFLGSENAIDYEGYDTFKKHFIVIAPLVITGLNKDNERGPRAAINRVFGLLEEQLHSEKAICEHLKGSYRSGMFKNEQGILQSLDQPRL